MTFCMLIENIVIEERMSHNLDRYFCCVLRKKSFKTREKLLENYPFFIIKYELGPKSNFLDTCPPLQPQECVV